MLPGFKSSSASAGVPNTRARAVIEFTFPSRDYDRRQTIANDVHARAAHVHQFIDTENNGHTDRSESCRHKRIQRPQQNDK